MLTLLIATIIVSNLGGLVLLYVQSRATARMCVEIYNAANGAVIKSAELVESATAVRGQLEQDRLEVVRMIAALRPLVRSLTEDFRGGARS